jgi:acyl-CoA thioesterase-1
MILVRVLLALVCSSMLAGCSARDTTSAASIASAPTTSAPAVAPSEDTHEGYPRIVILGDSLTAGYGLEKDQSYLALLQHHLDAEGFKYNMVNAGVSGDTSAGGLRRLDWSLEGDVRVLVVALGGNDGLRGLPVDQLKKNLAEIIERGQGRGATVILAGMEAPPNYGPEYTRAFHQAYRDLARQYDVPLIPFLLEGVAGIPSLNQPDGIHPNVAGAQIVERTVWGTLAPVLQRARR